ncbi:MAG: 30S ribosomal protein S18 [Candidatus Levybacteria bacterium]|nr:30S ribosomal protein S18 [Candidatus Levybacteria bacterium]
MAKEKFTKRRRIKPAPKECFFCSKKLEPSFKEAEVLRRWLTERGKIVPASRNGLCSKHQKALGKNIKLARFLALLPYVVV